MHDLIEREIDRAASSYAVDEPDLPKIVARGRKRLWMRRAAGALTVGAIVLAAPFAWSVIDAQGRSPAPRDDRAVLPAADYEWQQVPEAPIEGRVDALSVWTGEEFIVWGGNTPNLYRQFPDGAAYDPGSGQWRELARGPIEATLGRTAVWTGDEMLVWGGARGFVRPEAGHAAHSERPDNGAAYVLATDSWRELSASPIWSFGRHSAVWTGTEMIVFGGIVGAQMRDEAGERIQVPAGGAAYNPAADQWRALPEPPIAERHSAAAVWTGTEVVVWGGRNWSGQHVNDGAAYDPETDTWRVLSDSPLSPRETPLAISIGGRVVLWGGTVDEAQPTKSGVAAFVATDGAIYDPVTDSWEMIPPVDLGVELPFIQGGAVGDRLLAIAGDIGLYEIDQRSWRELPVPNGFGGGFAVTTTEDSIFVWGGRSGDDLHNRGAILTLDE